jgi:hypothetical protein
LILLDKSWALVIIPNKDSYLENLTLLFLEKLINQFNKIIIGLAALVEVFVTEIRIRLVASATSVDSIFRLTRIIEYWLIVSWPIFLSILIT